MAAGVDTHPGDAERLHQYWVAGAGRARWSTWRELYHHLLKYLPPDEAKRTASKWHFEVFHQHTGSDAYRVEHGGKMRGNRIGPG